MADYKNEQWWIDLQKSLEGFDDENSKMTDSDLGRWNGAKIGGRKGGATNAKSGHMKEIQKKAASLGGKIMGPIIGKKYGKYNMEKMTKEDKVRGGKTAGRKAVESGTLLKASKIGAKISTENRIALKIEKYKSILKFIRKKEFTYTDMRNACEKFGIKGDRIAGQAKKILREKTLIKQIHKGYNQFNPSLYIKVK
jgi:hypothetical protein